MVNTSNIASLADAISPSTRAALKTIARTDGARLERVLAWYAAASSKEARALHHYLKHSEPPFRTNMPGSREASSSLYATLALLGVAYLHAVVETKRNPYAAKFRTHPNKPT
ncbi:MAG: hypothetical protein ACKVZJ_14255 [Phycisphaerales bacterium]